MLSPHSLRVAYMIFFSTAAAVLGLLPPYISKRIVDDVILSSSDGRMRTLAIACGAMLAIGIVRCFANYFAGVLSAKIGANVVLNLRNSLHDALLHSELNFFGARNSGEYTGRIMSDTEDIQRFLVDGSRDLVTQGLTMFGIAAAMFWLNWRLALIAILPAPFLVVISLSFHRSIHDVFHDQGTGIAKLNTHISETIGGIRTIKAFSSQERRAAAFAAAASNVAAIRIDITRRFMRFFSETGAIMDLAGVLVFFFAASAIICGRNATLGDLTAFTAYAAMFYGPLRWLTHIYSHTVNALVSAERIFFILDAPREDVAVPATNSSAAKRAPASVTSGRIDIRDVHFSYEPGNEVLKGLSLSIAPGEMIGLVGRSGVGKTTLINLICRFFKVDSGEILIDGVNVNNMDLLSYRRQIGMVLQESFLFNTSVFENIACAKPDASEAEVIEAAKSAGAHDFIIALPQGYRTIIGEGGARLSGGERQRIAIARAILHNPPILILDEATSSVDTETERKIRDALSRLCKGRTVIAIAHRLSTLRSADRLAVIDGGRIAECGSHSQLLAGGGIFARLVAAQNELNEIGSNAWNPE